MLVLAVGMARLHRRREVTATPAYSGRQSALDRAAVFLVERAAQQFSGQQRRQVHVGAAIPYRLVVVERMAISHDLHELGVHSAAFCAAEPVLDHAHGLVGAGVGVHTLVRDREGGDPVAGASRLRVCTRPLLVSPRMPLPLPRRALRSLTLALAEARSRYPLLLLHDAPRPRTPGSVLRPLLP